MSSPKTEPANRDARRLLIVEDEADIREVLVECLSATGLQIDVAHDGEHALQMIEQAAYHAILSDIQMPKVTGIELFERLRASGLEIPFVFLTAFGERERMLEALRLGAFDFLEKPFDAENMIGVILKAVEVGVRDARIRNTLDRVVSGNLVLSSKGISYLRSERKMLGVYQVANKRRTKITEV